MLSRKNDITDTLPQIRHRQRLERLAGCVYARVMGSILR